MASLRSTAAGVRVSRFHGWAAAILLRLLILAGLQAAVSVADAALVINATEMGGDVVFTGSGSVDLAGLTYRSDVIYGNVVAPGGGLLSTAATGVSLYTTASAGGVTFGVGGAAAADVALGDDIFLLSDATTVYVGVPVGYSSGDPLNFSATFAGQSFASLQMWTGTYVWNLPSDTITMNIGSVAAVPEPSTCIAGAGFAALGVFLWRRRCAKRALCSGEAPELFERPTAE